ncbi:hypothetical protein [Paeniglutamicibacter cryotolerans]|nr:hypothetical protein [Paeniglutamicibacter cryotolerans]
MERRGQHRAPVQLGRLLPDGSGAMLVETIATLDDSGMTQPGPGLSWFTDRLEAKDLPCPW